MVGATLADWQRRREEERRRIEEERRCRAEEGGGNITARRLGLKAQEDAVRERWQEQKNSGAGGKAQPAPQKIEPPMPKGLSPEAQAAYLHGGAAASNWITKNANTLQAQFAADLAKQKEKERDKAAFDYRMGEHTGEQAKVDTWKTQQHRLSEHEETMASSNGIFNQLSAGITPLVQDLSHTWNGFVSNLTAPAQQTGPLFGNNHFHDSMTMINGVGVLLDQTLFDGRLSQATANLRDSLESNRVYNAINNGLGFGAGAALQYVNDNSFGLIGNVLHVNWENGSDAFQAGMEFGRTASTILGVVEIVVGAATAAFFLSTMPPSGALTLGCAGATGGICLIPGALAIAMEAVMAGAGAAIAWHGVNLEMSNANRPLEIRGDGSGGSTARPEGKTEAEMDTYEDARREGLVGESDHVDDGTSSMFDFIERLTGMRWDAKKPVSTLFRSAEKQAQDIAKHIKATPVDVPTYINLKNFTQAEKDAFKAEFQRLGVDMSKVVFVNK